MQSKVESLSPTKVKLSISLDATVLAKAKRLALEKLSKDITVAGYRRGKAPLPAVEKQLNPNTLSEETLQFALSDSYTEALIKHQIRPIDEPEITLKAFVPYSTLEYEAITEAIGKVKLGKYSGLNLKMNTVKVDKAEIDKVLSGLQKQLAKRVEVKEAAAEGDEVVIDFDGRYKESGEAINGGSGKDYPLELGSQSFIPGFETKLIGSTANEERELELTFPKDYQAAFLRGKPAIFKVKIKSVKRLELPKLDDKFAQRVGNFKTLDELKKDIEREIKANKQNEAELDFQNRLVEAISQASSVDIPDSLINDEVQRIEREQRQNASYRSQTWSEYLQSEGTTEAEFKKLATEQAEARVKAGLVLGEIAAKEDIQVSEAELNARINGLKQQYAQDQSMQAELNNPVNQRDLRSRMMVEKTVSRLKELNS